MSTANFKCMFLKVFGARRIEKAITPRGLGSWGPHHTRVARLPRSVHSDWNRAIRTATSGWRKAWSDAENGIIVRHGGGWLVLMEYSFNVDARGRLARGRVPNTRRRVPLMRKWREFRNFSFLRNFEMARSIFRKRSLARSVSRALRAIYDRTD